MKAKEELGKALLNLANMLTVLFLFNTYLQKEQINFWIVMVLIYAIVSLYWIGFYLIKENS
jgi:Ca2+/Na+ antiporter